MLLDGSWQEADTGTAVGKWLSNGRRQVDARNLRHCRWRCSIETLRVPFQVATGHSASSRKKPLTRLSYIQKAQILNRDRAFTKLRVRSWLVTEAARQARK